MGRIVVGVDGSPGSIEALRWAVAEAELRGERVEAIHAWTFPPYLGSPMGTLAPLPPKKDLEAEAERVLAEALQAVGGGDVEQVVVEDAPSRTLIERSKGADLLVVGSRGHGGFRELLLGSVSHQCVLHAHCPVVVIPPAR